MLLDAVAQEAARAALHYSYAALMRAEALHDPMRRGLRALFSTDPPVGSVSELAQLVGCDDATLYKWWSRDIRSSVSSLSLKQLLDTVLLLAMRSRKSGRPTRLVVRRRIGDIIAAPVTLSPLRMECPRATLNACLGSLKVSLCRFEAV
jgi:hypothetical protein